MYENETESPDRPYLGPVQTQPNEMVEPDKERVTFTFGDAVVLLKAGLSVQRLGWNGKEMWLHMQRPDANSKMSLPYIYMHTAQGEIVPWLASQSDVIETDWIEV